MKTNYLVLMITLLLIPGLGGTVKVIEVWMHMMSTLSWMSLDTPLTIFRIPTVKID